jgi:hypothetical protein
MKSSQPAPNMDENSMDSSMDEMWAAKVDQLELGEVIKKHRNQVSMLRYCIVHSSMLVSKAWCGD